MQEKYGAALRREREASGLSIEEVSLMLENLGFKIAPKTLYGYENDVSSPKISVFMALCQIYHVSDVYSSFNIAPITQPSSLNLSPHERQMLLAYRANPEAQAYVDKLLGLEPEPADIPKQA